MIDKFIRSLRRVYRIQQAIDRIGSIALSPPYGGMGYFYNSGPRTSKRIALTFDDGPSKPSTVNLLDTMEALAVRGTFFCVGANAAMHPDVLLRMYSSGHVIANHSMRHLRKNTFGLEGDAHFVESELEIAKVIGRRTRLYRPPWGWLTPWDGRRLGRRGYSIIGWDVYTYDWQFPEVRADAIAAGIMRDRKPGSIILLHDALAGEATCNKTNTIEVVTKIVPTLRAEGYEFVTIPDLLGVTAYAPL